MSDARWSDPREYDVRDRSDEWPRVYDPRDRDEHDPRDGLMRTSTCRVATSTNWSSIATGSTSLTARTAARWPPSAPFGWARNTISTSRTTALRTFTTRGSSSWLTWPTASAD